MGQSQSQSRSQNNNSPSCSSPASACPMEQKTTNPVSSNESMHTSCSYAEAASHTQITREKSHAASNSLANDRVTSSIPRANSSENWMYPSEAMFYSAMLRKGYSPNTTDMPSIIPIHNIVNEQTWQQILAYEQLHSCECSLPKLERFMGRPNDLTIQARINHWIWGYKLPFDRHDWIVDRCGKKVRYIIDFYEGRNVDGVPVSVYVHARPDLSIQGIKDRLMFLYNKNVKRLLKNNTDSANSTTQATTASK